MSEKYKALFELGRVICVFVAVTIGLVSWAAVIVQSFLPLLLLGLVSFFLLVYWPENLKAVRNFFFGVPKPPSLEEQVKNFTQKYSSPEYTPEITEIPWWDTPPVQQWLKMNPDTVQGIMNGRLMAVDSQEYMAFLAQSLERIRDEEFPLDESTQVLERQAKEFEENNRPRLLSILRDQEQPYLVRNSEVVWTPDSVLRAAIMRHLPELREMGDRPFSIVSNEAMVASESATSLTADQQHWWDLNMRDKESPGEWTPIRHTILIDLVSKQVPEGHLAVKAEELAQLRQLAARLPFKLTEGFLSWLNQYQIELGNLDDYELVSKEAWQRLQDNQVREGFIQVERPVLQRILDSLGGAEALAELGSLKILLQAALHHRDSESDVVEVFGDHVANNGTEPVSQ